MKQYHGATSLGESQHRFKTDVNLIFGNQRRERQYVLRTTLHSLSVWRTRNPGVGLSPFKIKNLQMIKEAAIVDREVWVFNVNGTVPQDIIAAVKVACSYYNVSPSTIFSDIYAKNLNVERENSMADQALIRANKDLYMNVCKTIAEVARQLGITNEVNFYVFSKNNNPKIPVNDLHDALKEGGAHEVKADVHRHKVHAARNDDSDFVTQMTNFHMARLRT
jgi:hypothetical protein